MGDKVLGLQLNERLKALGKKILYMQACLALLGVAYAVGEIIQHILVLDAWHKLTEASGEEKSQNILTGALNAFSNIAVAGSIPCALLVAARMGISSNRADCLQLVCIADVCCSCCAFVGGSCSVLTFMVYMSVAQYADEVRDECREVAAASSATIATTTSSSRSVEDCISDVDQAARIVTIVAAFGAINACLAFTACIDACCASTAVNDGSTRLKAGDLFVGAPVQAVPGTTQVVGVPCSPPTNAPPQCQAPQCA